MAERRCICSLLVTCPHTTNKSAVVGDEHTTAFLLVFIEHTNNNRTSDHHRPLLFVQFWPREFFCRCSVLVPHLRPSSWLLVYWNTLPQFVLLLWRPVRTHFSMNWENQAPACPVATNCRPFSISQSMVSGFWTAKEKEESNEGLFSL